MAVQWLRLQWFHYQGPGLIPGQGTKILQDVRHGQKTPKNKNKKTQKRKQTNKQKTWRERRLGYPGHSQAVSSAERVSGPMGLSWLRPGS